MKKKQIVALTLSVLLSSTIMGSPVVAEATSKEEIKNKIEENDKKIDDLKDKKAGLQGEKAEKAEKLEEAKVKFNEQNKLLTETRNKVFEFQKEIDALELKINDIENQIKLVEKEIADVKIQIDKKQKEVETKQEILGKRLRSTYMSNLGDRMLYMIIDSKNFGDLLSNIANINIIVKTDQQLISEIEKDKQIIEDDKKALENKEAGLVKSKTDLEVSQKKVEDSKSEVDALEAKYAQEAAKLKDIEDERNREYSALTDREKALQDEIAKFEEDNTNLDHLYENLSKGPTVAPPATGGSTNGNNDQNTGGGSTVSSGFIRPTSGVVTSPYGSRIHPISGKQSFHTGIDYAPPHGTAIKASASGTVTSAGWLGGYGNAVIVDHGNGYSSLYAHASSLSVSVGQKVSQGQVIAAVGSTGNSTGPHLHFEIRYNGKHVNPANYVR